MTLSPALSTPLGLLRQAESWLDARGRPAWIAAMVVGFIAAPPLGLALLGYMIWADKFSRNRRKETEMFCCSPRKAPLRTSGNAAFDAYKAEALQRLEDEQAAFEAFLARLRAAKDQQEFDRFMEDRAKQVAEGDKPGADT